jgi:hypothetical protein
LACITLEKNTKVKQKLKGVYNKINMAFKLLSKGVMGKIKILPNQISIRKNNISFGENITKTLSSFGEYIEIYLDREKNKIAFRGTNNAQTGFKFRLEKSAYSEKAVVQNKIDDFNAEYFGIFETVFKDNLFIIDVHPKTLISVLD